MLKYIFKRLAIGLLTLFILTTVTFFAVRAIPGSPFSQDTRNVTPETYAALEAKWGLDKPLIEQYATFLVNALQLDFGESIAKKGQMVVDIVIQRAPTTFKLGLIAFIIAVVVGLTLGIIGALTKRRWVNGVITVVATLGVSIPGFLLAIIMMYFFAVKFGLLPVMGLTSWKHYILPSLALAFGPISMITRLTRSSLRDVMANDYITLAKSKGTKDVVVIIKHGLKNALLPVITYCGPMFAGLVTGSLVIERLFTINGIGAEFTNSVSNRDYTLVMGLTIFLGSIVILMNLITDLIAAIIDPRIKLGK